MCLFRKKKFYEVICIDMWGDEYTGTVYASSQIAAVRKIMKPWNVAQIVSVKEVTF